MHRIGVDLREPRVERVHIGRPKPFGGELRKPRPDMRRPYRAELHRTEGALDASDVYLRLPDRTCAVAAVALEPGVAPVGDGRPGLTRCHVRAGNEPRGLLIEPTLRVD